MGRLIPTCIIILLSNRCWYQSAEYRHYTIPLIFVSVTHKGCNRFWIGFQTLNYIKFRSIFSRLQVGQWIFLSMQDKLTLPIDYNKWLLHSQCHIGLIELLILSYWSDMHSQFCVNTSRTAMNNPHPSHSPKKKTKWSWIMQKHVII